MENALARRNIGVNAGENNVAQTPIVAIQCMLSAFGRKSHPLIKGGSWGARPRSPEFLLREYDVFSRVSAFHNSPQRHTGTYGARAK
jgi:hypothetical protein